LTLTTRLSVFFLATLALVLGGLSGALYLLTRAHLHRQAEERLQAALNTLIAAAEISPEGLEWEPAQRQLKLGPAALSNEIVWLIADDKGQTVDRSQQAGTDALCGDAAQDHAGPVDWQGQRWLRQQQRIQATTSSLRPLDTAPPSEKDQGRTYPSLAITAGVSLAPADSELRRQAGISAGLSLGIWVLAFFLSRFICRRALLPVTRMALAARQMNADDLTRRLPATTTRDELENLSRSFNHLLDRLQESFERQQRFTGDASHQLRTPLAAMMGQVEVALRRERPTAEYQRVLATVQQQAEHLRRIVEALLFLARADSETKLSALECVNLNYWLPAHLQTWSEHERAGDIQLECNAKGPAGVRAQPVLLGELLNVLIDNACKFSPPGTPITVRLSQDEKVASIDVIDHGCGISETDLAHVGTPFFRSALSRQHGIDGIGLGLSVARRLARAFGGDLTATSTVGVETCFTVRLPAPATRLRPSAGATADL
jgi:heavy metal sensor kinase